MDSINEFILSNPNAVNNPWDLNSFFQKSLIAQEVLSGMMNDFRNRFAMRIGPVSGNCAAIGLRTDAARRQSHTMLHFDVQVSLRKTLNGSSGSQTPNPVKFERKTAFFFCHCGTETAIPIRQ